jgi:hypothetical protein
MSKSLHIVTQRDQPYGSVRKCCERCGHYSNSMDFTDNPDLWNEPPPGYRRCNTIDDEMRFKRREFLKKLRALCEQHGISIAHEDGNGAFLLEDFSEKTMRWLEQADYGEYLP